MRNALLAALAVLTIGVFAFMFRYEPVSPNGGIVWDRLTQRMCRAGDPWSGPPGGPFCTLESYDAAVDAAAAARKAAALARVTALANAAAAAGPADAAAAKDRLTAAIIAAREAGATDADLGIKEK